MLRSLIFLIVMAGTLPARSEACSCSEPEPPPEALAGATAVFTGRILAAEPDGGNGYAYTIEVHAVWKGPLAATVVVATSEIGMCGLWMPEGSAFLVYALGGETALTTNNCTRSRPLEFASEDLEALGEPLAVSGDDLSITLIKSRYD